MARISLTMAEYEALKLGANPAELNKLRQQNQALKTQLTAEECKRVETMKGRDRQITEQAEQIKKLVGLVNELEDKFCAASSAACKEHERAERWYSQMIAEQKHNNDLMLCIAEVERERDQAVARRDQLIKESLVQSAQYGVAVGQAQRERDQAVAERDEAIKTSHNFPVTADICMRQRDEIVGAANDYFGFWKDAEQERDAAQAEANTLRSAHASIFTQGAVMAKGCLRRLVEDNIRTRQGAIQDYASEGQYLSAYISQVQIYALVALTASIDEFAVTKNPYASDEPEPELQDAPKD